MMTIHNPNCSGSHCQRDHGEVRIYPYGGGSNGIYCRACFEHENRYRAQRVREGAAPENFPQVAWDTAEVYHAGDS